MNVKEFFERIGEYVFHPDYDKGEWSVHWRRWKKVCANKATAQAWAKYIRRNFTDGWTATIGKVNLVDME